MGVRRRLGQGVGMVWLGALLGLMVGTAVLELLFPDVKWGVRFVVYGTVVLAPVLYTVWFYRRGRPGDEAQTSGGTDRDEEGPPEAG